MSGSRKSKKKPKDPFICLCNGVKKSEVEKAIDKGCTTLAEIYDETRAGVGACGGSCRIDLIEILETYSETGEFPQEYKRNRDR